MNNARSLLNGYIGGLTQTAIGVAASFIQFSLLIHYFPLEVAGTWIAFVSLGAYVTLFDLGICRTLSREVSFAVGDPNLTERNRAVRIRTLAHSVIMVVALMASLALLLGISGGWRYLATVTPVSLLEKAHTAWWIFTIGAAFNLLSEGWLAGIYGLGQVFREKMVRSLSIVIGLIFLTIAMVGRSFTGLAVAYYLQAVCTLLIAKYMFFRSSPRSDTKGTFELSAVRGTIAPSLKYAATLLGGILILQTDNLVIASTLGPKYIPNYQAVSKMISIMMQLSMMFVMTSLPLASLAYARHDTSQLLRLMNRNLRYSLSVMVVLGSFVACFADRVIFAWLGPNHFVGFPVVWVLLIVMLLEAHHQCMAAATMATGKIVFGVPTLVAGVLNIVFSIFLAHRYGVLGVVLGTLMAQLTTNNWYVTFYTLRNFHLRFRDHISKILIPVLVLLVVLLSADIAARFVTRGLPGVVSILGGILCTGVVGPATFFFIVLNSEERGRLTGKVRSMYAGHTTVTQIP